MLFFKLIKKQKLMKLSILIILLLAVLEPILSFAQEDTSKKVRVGWYESGYCRTDHLGRRTGPMYEYQMELAAFAGWSYEYVHGTWPELYKKLENGEIDLLSDVSYTEDREKKILYSAIPIGEESYYICVRNDNTEIDVEKPTTFNGKRFAVYPGTIQEILLKNWALENNLDIVIENSGKHKPAQHLEMLHSGEIDAYVNEGAYVGNYDFYPIVKLGSSKYFFGVSLKSRDLLPELNLAMLKMNRIDPNYMQKLDKKYSNTIKTSAVASIDEKEWLKKHGVIRIGYKDDYSPFCKNDENGKVSGLLKDYIDFAASSLSNVKLTFETIPYRTTDDAIIALQEGEVDCVFPVNVGRYDGELMGIMTTTHLFNAEIFSVLRKSLQYKDIRDEPLSVALVKKNFNFENFIKDHFPKWKINRCDSLEECFESVDNLTSDCILISSYRLNNSEKLRSQNNLSLISTSQYMDFSFALRIGDKELFSILTKTVNLIPSSIVDSSLSAYSNNRVIITFRDFVKDNIVPISIISIFVFVVIFTGLILFHQQKTVSNYRKKIILATERDSITELYNRNFFFEYARQMVADNQNVHYDAVAIDVSQFHIINTLLGSDFGDKILKTIGKEIRLFLKYSDAIGCRFDADHFGICCRHRENYKELFNQFQEKISSLSQMIEIRLRMSVMPWPDGVEELQIFDRTDSLYGKIHDKLKCQLIIYDDEFRTQRLREVQLLNDLRRGLNEREFIPYYQPKYNIQTDPPKLCSAEALVRWRHPELGMIQPGEFIPLFENEGQISQLDQYMWREAARQIAEWRDRYGIIIPISVNLSRMDVFDPQLESILDGIISDYGLKKSDLHLEVTESAYIDEVNSVIKLINKLKNSGYFIEMDDFGTGYSSLNMLSSMPIDILKLDRSFVIQIFNDNKVLLLVEFILDIAKVLHVPVVAEGVETESELNFLKERGCEMVQGYYFSKPLPAEEFEKKLRTI